MRVKDAVTSDMTQQPGQRSGDEKWVMVYSKHAAWPLRPCEKLLSKSGM